MSLDDATAELIEKVVAHAQTRPAEPGAGDDTPEQARVREAFLRQYFDRAVPDDLGERDAADLYGEAIAHSTMAMHRPAGASLLRVYLPDPELDGWRSTHTAIDLVTDDMPFLVDSVTNAVNRHDLRVHLVLHPVIRVRRDVKHNLVGIGPPRELAVDGSPGTDRPTVDIRPGNEWVTESFIHLEVDRVRPHLLDTLTADIQRVLADVTAAVDDWPAMTAKAVALSESLAVEHCPADDDEVSEAVALLRWMVDDHFTFLGYREYRLAEDTDGLLLREVRGTGLGILRDDATEAEEPHAVRLSRTGQRSARGPHPLVLTKANSRTTVHRGVYLDYIGVKHFDADGHVIGERRFLGLFASGAYSASVFDVPVIRRKVPAVIERAALPPDGHANKRLIEILETYPRYDLFQISVDELFEHALGILRLQERQRVRLFVRRDHFERFVSCIVYVPRDRYTTQVRERMTAILQRDFVGTSVDFTARVTDSVLARLHFVVHTAAGATRDVDVDAIEDQLVEAVRSWSDDLYDAAVDTFGEQEGIALYHLYADGFPASYRDDFEVGVAIDDIRRLDELDESDDLAMSLYRPAGALPTVLRMKFYRSGTRILLSEVLPLLENLGVTVIDERPYAIVPAGGPLLWIYDFGLQVSEHASREIDNNRDLFLDAFRAVWSGDAESDGFNRLVLEAGLRWRTVSVIRAYHKYQRQIGSMFSQTYVEQCLVRHADLVRLAMAGFDARFNPHRPGNREADLELLDLQLVAGLDAVASLDEDRILRSFRDLIAATLRTNFFQRDPHGGPKPCLSVKLDPARIPDLPLPRPMFEIFVYSPRFEGVHLRGGRVARGGLRWSDRREDFRTEILGLMKAQMVKNAVIVPTGAKGGFVLKQLPSGSDRDATMAEGVACYRTFIAGLLDLTDNLVGGEVVPPPDLLRHDGDDTYLVVAADKGTATFSDIANEISLSYDFWLGDAFASGGSAGYDHKGMGITAKGAWESVKRHFRALGVDTQTTDFTVVGVGDMSGDVFGNGMLLSPHIRLLGAFDHRHVFLDPEPDAAAAFAERRRLFQLPRSSWDDYDRSLIAEGGGVFPRTAKSIPISPQVRASLQIDDTVDAMTPDELVHAVLRAPVDLLFNGGIGTYVKASTESHQEVGDKANDAVRVDGRDLRCRVVGEGGNLGCTQRGRVEYARAGGRIFTDAIDNSAGVDCSDHEVNIKILLDAVVRQGSIDVERRDGLLVAMTDDVAAAVLRDNYENCQALSIGQAQAASLAEVHSRYIDDLERQGRLDRAVEFLPPADELAERIARGNGLTAPELAVLQAYTKVLLSDEVLDSDLPEDPFLLSTLAGYFPPLVRDTYRAQIEQHPLRREIIATGVSNLVVNIGGTSLLYRMADESQAPAATIVFCHLAASTMFDLESLWERIESLDNKVDAATQVAMLLAGRRLIERATRWLLMRTHLGTFDLTKTVERFRPGLDTIRGRLADVLIGTDLEHYDVATSELIAKGVPSDLATRVAGLEALYSGLDIIEVAADAARDPVVVAAVYFELTHRLHLDWLRDQITALPRDNRWHTLARASIRADLYERLRVLTASAVHDRDAVEVSTAGAVIDEWAAQREHMLERYQRVLADLGDGDTADLAVLSVALHAVHDLTDA